MLRWAKQFVKENFIFTFSAVVNFHLGKPIENKAQVLVECLMGLGNVSNDQIILSDKSDEFLFLPQLLVLINQHDLSTSSHSTTRAD